MSWRAAGIVKAIKGDTGITRSEKFLLLILADYHNDETGQCNPSQARLAAEALMSKRGVQIVLTSLAAKGFIEIEHKYTPTGGYDSSQYWLICLGATGGGGETSSPGGWRSQDRHPDDPPFARGGDPRLRQGGDPPFARTVSRTVRSEPKGEPKRARARSAPSRGGPVQQASLASAMRRMREETFPHGEAQR